MWLLGLWLLFGLIGIAIGQKKGLNLAVAFIGGLLLGPLSFLMVFVKGDSKKCPNCAEMVKNEANVCRFCQHQFAAEDETTAEVTTHNSGIFGG